MRRPINGPIQVIAAWRHRGAATSRRGVTAGRSVRHDERVSVRIQLLVDVYVLSSRCGAARGSPSASYRSLLPQPIHHELAIPWRASGGLAEQAVRKRAV